MEQSKIMKKVSDENAMTGRAVVVVVGKPRKTKKFRAILTCASHASRPMSSEFAKLWDNFAKSGQQFQTRVGTPIMKAVEGVLWFSQLSRSR